MYINDVQSGNWGEHTNNLMSEMIPDKLVVRYILEEVELVET